MNDSESKERRPFEPPPWEREQFEELERIRNEREEPAPVQRQAPPDEAVAQKAQEMLFELAAQETVEYGERGWAWGLAASVFLGFVGVVFVVYATVALVRTRGAGAFALAGASVVGLIGFAMTGLAVMMAMRSWQRRGAR